jgi:2,4-dichlorophenol 6-monooxygenase
VAKQIVLRANQSSREFGQFFDALGMTGATTEQEMMAQIEERKASTPRGAAKRAALVEAMELKNYEFNGHGVELGQFYSSTAIVPDGSVRPEPDRDPAKVARDLGVPLEAVVIGPGREVTDIYYDWARIREVGEDGALLVRPDKHIGWRAMSLAEDPEAALRDAMTSLLSI